MPILTKHRVLKGAQWSSSTRSFNSTPIRQEGWLPEEVQKIQYENHPGYKTADGSKDVGGPFESYKLEIVRPGITWSSCYNYVNNPGAGLVGWQYETTTYLVAHNEIAQIATQIASVGKTDAGIASFLGARVPAGPSNSTLNAMGTRAIAAVAPTNPTFDLATTLGELMAERKFFSVPGKNDSLPGEYLNYQFGIAPTIGAFQDLREAIATKEKVMRQYQRDAGNVIRRKFRFEPERTVDRYAPISQRVVGMGPGLNTWQNPSGSLTRTTTTTQDYWFAGAFRYSIPQDAFPKQMAELDRLYGVVPGISTGWELVPFSWLVDYFSPIGSLLQNLDAFMKDGLVLPYAYIMSTTIVEDEYHWRGPIYNSGGSIQQVEVVSTVRKTRMRRLHATPFGFGLLAGDLTPKQFSILAALGLSLRK